MNYHSAWLSKAESQTVFLQLQKQLAWQQETIQMFGKPIKTPRLVAWYGDEFAFTSIVVWFINHCPWDKQLQQLRIRLEQQLEHQFNSVLANLYRDGHDYMGWHSDNEPELGSEPIIASISLGASRPLQFRHKKSKQKYELELEPGSLLIMHGQTQSTWQHCLPKRRKVTEARINLTFRYIQHNQVSYG